MSGNQPDPPTAAQVVERLVDLAAPGGPTKSSGSFRCDNPDEQFLGVPMRDVFAVAKQFAALEPEQVEQLLNSPVHEVRVAAVSVMDAQARRRSTPATRRQELYELYLRRHDRIDNWDLVDRAAPSVVGGYLCDRPRDPLYDLARSADPMRRRTAITATYHFLQRGQTEGTFAVAELLAADSHDLVQKAVGGWLREAGKHDRNRLLAFLDAHAPSMARIAVRYAVEHLDSASRRHYRTLTRPATTS